MAPLPDDIMNQVRDLPLTVTAEIATGKTYIVTGANVGLGYEAAKHLVSLGAATVIMGVRTASKGETAKAEIEEATGKKGVLQVWPIDKSSYESVKAFAEKAKTLDRIDGLLENAGVAQGLHKVYEGHVENMTVNVYGSFLLAVLLLPKMRDDAKRLGNLPHISLVTSGSAFLSGEDYEKIKDSDILAAIDNEETVSSGASYPLSKIVQMMAVKYFGEQFPLSSQGVVVNTVDPGICITTLSRNAPPEFQNHLKELHAAMGRTAEEGSRGILHGLVAGKESHGKFIDSCKINEERVPAWIGGEEAKPYQKSLWEGITKELNSAAPGCIDALA